MINAEHAVLSAVILAGGSAQRMQTAGYLGDKCLHDLNGRPILSQIVDLLSAQHLRISLNINGDPTRYYAFDLPILPDCVRDANNLPAGPLAGILTAMRFAQDEELVLTVAADTPFFPADLAQKLREKQSQTKADVVFASSAGTTHPTFGLWRTDLADGLKQWLSSGNKASIRSYAAGLKTVIVEFPMAILSNGNRYDPFFNINRPDDLALARQIQKTLTDAS